MKRPEWNGESAGLAGIACLDRPCYTAFMAGSSGKLHIGDALVVALSAILVVLLSIRAYGGAAYRPYALVSNGTRTWRYPLDTEIHAAIAGLNGDTIIHISDGAISIEDSPCPTKSCVAMGSISHKGQWLVCMPNGIFITIEGSTESGQEVDDVSG
ncbi:MAG: NusG domain II-containing protein [Sphaerochaetaceae bacterium]|jgi:hypothetical protein